MGFRKLFFIVGIVVVSLQPIKSDYYGNNLCACTREFSPICATNGVTYQNGCLFDCAKQQNVNLCIRSYGQCIQISVFNVPIMETVKTCACPYYLQSYPVCGSDGRIYSNQCEFNCAKKFNGNLQAMQGNQCVGNQQLQPQPSFTQAFAPSSQTFGPPSQQFAPSTPQIPPLQPTQTQQFFPPFAPSQPQLPQLPPPQPLPPQVNTINGCACPFNFDPVCGNDGKTYSNECEFNCAKTFNANLQLVSRGKCNGIQLGIQPQFQTQQPQVQTQQPQFQPQAQPQPQPQFPMQQPQFQAQPEFQNQAQPAVSQASACGCPNIVEYICGSDGRTYANGCELNCARRYDSNLRMHSKGKCNGAPPPAPMQPISPPPQMQNVPPAQPLMCACPYNLDELCGNDGRTYSNQCEFNCAKQYNGNLGIVSRGRCNVQNQLTGWFTG